MLSPTPSVGSSGGRTTGEPMNPAPPVTNTTVLRNRMDQRPIDLLLRPAAPGDEPLVLESGISLSVAQRRSVEAEHAAPGGIQDGMAGGRVPFHGGGEARIDIGIAAGNQAEFQGRTGTLDFGHRLLLKPLLGLRIHMRSAVDGAQTRARNRAGFDDRHGVGSGEGLAGREVRPIGARASYVNLREGRHPDGPDDPV